MTDIEQKALALVSQLQEEDGYKKYSHAYHFEALCRAIEQHEAFKQEVSEVMMYIKAVYPALPRNFNRFIITKNDPLVEALTKAGWGMPEINAKELRAALDAVGFEIREKSDA